MCDFISLKLCNPHYLKLVERKTKNRGKERIRYDNQCQDQNQITNGMEEKKVDTELEVEANLNLNGTEEMTIENQLEDWPSRGTWRKNSVAVRDWLSKKWDKVEVGKVAKFGKIRLTARGLAKLTRKNDVWVLGPPRVGKSCLIKAITNYDSIEERPSMDSITKERKKYPFKHFNFWDTPGIENWSEIQAEHVWRDSFENNSTLPLAVWLCFAPNTFFPLSSKAFVAINHLCNKYKVPMFFVCCNARKCTEEDHRGFVNNFKEYLKITDLSYDTKLTFKNPEIRPTIRRMVGKERAYFALVNSKIHIDLFGTGCDPYGVDDLIECTMMAQTPAAKEEMLRFYLSQQKISAKVESFLFDVAFSIGIPVQRLLRDDNEKTIYLELRKC